MSRDDLTVSRLACVMTGLLFILGLLQLGLRLREVQIDGAADYSYASARQSLRRVQTNGSRGRILDRQGRILAGNRLSLVIAVDPGCFQARSWEATVKAIETAVAAVAKIVGMPSSLDTQAISRHVNQSVAMPLPVWRDVRGEALERFCERAGECPGFRLLELEERTYPYGAVASHVLGYVGRDRGEAQAGDESFTYFEPEMRGRSGLEHYYDGFLRGGSGEKKLLVDARGFAMREWSVVQPQQGPDLRLSIDVRIQAAAERQLAGCCGACAVIDPRNGEILAMASAPGFDPNDFVPTLRPDVYRRYADDPDRPLLNRVCGGAYAPGSTFKPITALAGLFCGRSPSERYDCTGVYSCGTMHLRCASRWGHGEVDMPHALMKSCNPYFCRLGCEIGTNALIRTAKAFGLGRKTGLDSGVDMAGTVPDGEWKMRQYGQRWYAGDLAQMAIGQGMLLVSPLQMALVAGALGTGRLVVPHLKLDLPPRSEALPFPAADLEVVRRGLRLVITGDEEGLGTGRRAAEGVPVPFAGKTGTAEVGPRSRRRKNTWFIAYAPVTNATVAVALVVENGESGGGTAAPKVGEILKAVFDGR